MKTLVIPVIHYEDPEQVVRNAERAHAAGCAGVMVIHMAARNSLVTPAAKAVKERWPGLLVGINLLGRDAESVVLTSIEAGLDMTWTDEQLTHSNGSQIDEASLVAAAAATAPGHLVFSGVAFKHQAHEPDPSAAAAKAVELGLVPTTSGPATGVAANPADVVALRNTIGPGAPLAIASGITPTNAALFTPSLTHVLVSTGVSSSFHEFDEKKLRALRAACDAARP